MTLLPPPPPRSPEFSVLKHPADLLLKTAMVVEGTFKSTCAVVVALGEGQTDCLALRRERC